MSKSAKDQNAPALDGVSKVQLTRMAETALGTRGPRSKLHRLLEQGHPALLAAVADIRAGQKRVRDILTHLNKALEAAEAEDRPIAYQAFSRFARRLQQRQETLRQAGEETQRLLGGFTKSITDVAAEEPRSDRDLLACEIIKTLLYDLLSAQAQSGELPSLDMLKHAASILNTVESAAQRASARSMHEGEVAEQVEGLTHQTVEALRQHLFGATQPQKEGA